MKTIAIQQLELDARWAYVTGTLWADYFANHADAIRAAEPYDASKYHRLVARLLALVVSGDTDGQNPAGDDAMPWERDDEPTSPHDTITQARLLADAIPGVSLANDLPAKFQVLLGDNCL